MRKVTSITAFETSVGTKLAMTYSEIDSEGNIIKENERINKIVVDETAKADIEKVKAFAQSLVDAIG